MPFNLYLKFFTNISVDDTFSSPQEERREKSLRDTKIPSRCTLISLLGKSRGKSGTWDDGKKIPLFAKRETT